jgi:hypothetical protein
MVLGGKRVNRLPQYHLSSEDDDESGSEAESDGSHLNIDLSENENEEQQDLEDEEEEDVPSIPPTKRIAAVNLDWDNLRAADLYSVFNSFLSMSTSKGKGEGSSSGLGRLLDVKIYPSQFGKERMEKEEQEGPGGGIFVGNAGISKKKQGILVDSEDESEGEEEYDDESDDEELEGSVVEQGSEDEEEFSDDDGLVDLDDEEDEDDEDDDLSRGPKRALPEVDGLEILSDVSSEAEEGDIDMDKLRQYQLERLR